MLKVFQYPLSSRIIDPMILRILTFFFSNSLVLFCSLPSLSLRFTFIELLLFPHSYPALSLSASAHPTSAWKASLTSSFSSHLIRRSTNFFGKFSGNSHAPHFNPAHLLLNPMALYSLTPHTPCCTFYFSMGSFLK